MAKTTASKPSKTEGKGKGKQPKRFLEHKDSALELASAIADVQESKAREKVEKTHLHARSTARNDTKPRQTSKERLAQAKAAVKAQKLRAKKERLKARKAERGESVPAAGPAARTLSSPPQHADGAPVKRKRVAFA